MKVFVCYEENNHGLAIECGAINGITVLDKAEKALEWFKKRVYIGINDGFIIDSEDEAYVGKDDFNDSFVKERIAEGWATVTMFNGYQENWDESYAICVYEQEVQ